MGALEPRRGGDDEMRQFFLTRSMRRELRDILVEHARTNAMIKSVVATGQHAMEAAVEIDDYRIKLLGTDPTGSRNMALVEVECNTIEKIKRVQNAQFDAFGR